ncbi:MAG TPA: tetratricopeptide repeat protein [Patescibacteria group bacterium]|nr:tetratricopeptide repeat protein [Patescibacteria group bacterium]
MTRTRMALLTLALLVVLYGAASMRRLEATDAMMVVDLPLLGTSPVIAQPGWHLVPLFLGRVSHYPASPVKLSVSLSGPQAARTREGATVELAAELTYSIPADRLLALHRAHGPGYESDWLIPLVKTETAARVGAVSFELVRNRDPELARGLRARLDELMTKDGPRIESLRVAQTAGVGESSGGILQVSGKPADRDLVIIGVDSFDWRLIDPLMKQGRMPNMARLIQRGVRANLRTIRPILSPVIWTSIATGVKPSRHGIADFVVTARDTGALVPVTSSMRQVPALWNLMSRQGIDVNVIAWWATWPAETVRGSVVTDRVAFQLFEKSIKDDWKSTDPAKKKGKTYPAGLFDELAPLIVAPNEITDQEVGWFLPQGRIPPSATPDQREQLDALRTVIAAGETYHRIALKQFKTSGARLRMVYYEGPDEASHLFMRYRPPLLAGVNPADMDLFGSIVEKYYERQDRYIGEIVDAVGPGATIILASDHGFKSDNNRPPNSDPRIGKGDAAEWHTPVGVLVMAGPAIRAGADIGAASVLDIAPTSLVLFGLPATRDMDGQPLEEALDPVFLRQHPVAWIDSYGGARQPGQEMAAGSEAEAGAGAGDAEMIEKLRSLGYIGEEQMTAHNNRGMMAIDDGDFDGAIAEFERGLASKSDAAPLIQANLASAFLQKGDLDKARSTAEQSLAGNPRNKGAMMVLAGVAMKRGDPAEAVRQLRRAIQVDPTFVPAHAKLGEVLQKMGDDTAALAEFEKVVEISPLSAVEYNNIGNIHRKRGDVDRAMQAFRDAIKADAQYIGAYNNLGLCLQDKGKLAEAKDLYEKALVIRPDNAILLNSLGTLLELQGNHAGAIAQVERAAKADPNWAVAAGNLATLYFEAGRMADARPMFESWTRLEPASAEARLGLALTLLMSQQRDEAIKQFDEVLRLDPANIRAHIALGETLARGGQLDKAQSHLERAVQLDPRIPRVYNTLGEIYLKRGLKQEAARAFQRSLALDPRQSQVKQRLSSVGN